MIDGVATFDGGYKVGGNLTTLGNGLDVTYGILSNPVADAINSAVAASVDSAGGTSQQTDSLALVGPLDGSSGGGLPGADSTQTVGGTEGTFGGDGSTTDSASSTDPTQDEKNAQKKPAQCSA